jgi:hypothetical protein
MHHNGTAMRGGYRSCSIYGACSILMSFRLNRVTSMYVVQHEHSITACDCASILKQQSTQKHSEVLVLSLLDTNTLDKENPRGYRTGFKF